MSDDQPTPNAGPVPLVLDLREAMILWLQTSPSVDERDMELAAADVVADRLSQYPGDTPASVIYADWFPTEPT